jgi:hypothetical protein
MTYWDGTRWVPDAPSPPPRKRPVRHVLGAIAEGTLITALIFGLVAGAAFAAKGGNSAHTNGHNGGHASSVTGTFSLVLVTDQNGDGQPNWGDSVTFDVSSTAAYPEVTLTCYRSGDWVTNQTVGFYDGWPWSQVFPLSSWRWTGGAADCDAVLFYQTKKGNQTLATMSFHVGG